LYALEDMPRKTHPWKMSLGNKHAENALTQAPGRAQATAQYNMLQYDTPQALARCSKDASPADAAPSVPKTAPQSTPTCESTDLCSQMTCPGAHPPKNA